ncbi:hypothetical protein LguiB_012304 [Lonicera macranthoides]
MKFYTQVVRSFKSVGDGLPADQVANIIGECARVKDKRGLIIYHVAVDAGRKDAWKLDARPGRSSSIPSVVKIMLSQWQPHTASGD